MHYCTGYCFNASDLFNSFDTKKLKIKKAVLQKNYGVNKRQFLCASVLVYCFYLILLDIIENNCTFVLPLFNGRDAKIYARPVVGDEFKRARKAGAFADIDILQSNFTGYQLTYSWKSLDGTFRMKPIHVNKRFQEVFIKHINEGKQYY